MKVLKSIGYLIAALAVLAALVFGGFLIFVVAIVIGVLFNVAAAVFFTAGGIRSYFERSD